MSIFVFQHSNEDFETLTTTEAWGPGRDHPFRIVIASIGLLQLLRNANDPPLFLQTGFTQPCDIPVLWKDPNLGNPAGGLVCPLILIRVEEGNDLNSELLTRAVRCLSNGSLTVPQTFNPDWDRQDDGQGIRHHALNRLWRFEFDGHASPHGNPARDREGGALLLNSRNDQGNLGIVVDFEPNQGVGFFVNVERERQRSAAFNAAFVAHIQ